MKTTYAALALLLTLALVSVAPGAAASAIVTEEGSGSSGSCNDALASHNCTLPNGDNCSYYVVFCVLNGF